MVNSQAACIIIGASHGGVNLAFGLRKEGWQGEIKLFDADTALPYHRPPLSKAYLTSNDGIEKNLLKSAESYNKENITLNLGVTVTAIDRDGQTVTTNNGEQHHYSKLVFATGARPFIPPIEGLDNANNVFPLRTAADVTSIRAALAASESKDVVVIGGGYIGLETAASLKKLGSSVTVLEREERILARVTAPFMSTFFNNLHQENGVDILTKKDVSSIVTSKGKNVVICSDGSNYQADIIIVGVGIRVNTELAQSIGLTVDNGILVDGTTCTQDKNIFAIGDCSNHFNPHYGRNIRLESVQNAVDQAKVAAAAICEKDTNYNTLPWFWSDQYDIKLQMVGLSQGYNKMVIRQEPDNKHKFSAWYFKDDTLLSVDAINNAKAYVVGTKLIKEGAKVDQVKLADTSVEFKPINLIIA